MNTPTTMTGWRKRSRIPVTMLLLAVLAGCGGQDTTSVDGEDDRDVNTANYIEDALAWDAAGGRWIFHSWTGNVGPGQCRIYINVHDSPANTPEAFRPAIAKEAVINARRIWKAAIREAGIDCSSITRFASEGDEMLTVYPRIDVHYVDVADNGTSRGQAGVTKNDRTRTFSRVYVEVACRYGSSNPLKQMSDQDYMTTTAHELGHALGIYRFGPGGGHSSNSNDLMYSPSQWSTLSRGDTRAIGAIASGNAYYKPVMNKDHSKNGELDND